MISWEMWIMESMRDRTSPRAWVSNNSSLAPPLSAKTTSALSNQAEEIPLNESSTPLKVSAGESHPHSKVARIVQAAWK